MLCMKSDVTGPDLISSYRNGPSGPSGPLCDGPRGDDHVTSVVGPHSGPSEPPKSYHDDNTKINVSIGKTWSSAQNTGFSIDWEIDSETGSIYFFKGHDGKLNVDCGSLSTIFSMKILQQLLYNSTPSCIHDEMCNNRCWKCGIIMLNDQ